MQANSQIKLEGNKINERTILTNIRIFYNMYYTQI